MAHTLCLAQFYGCTSDELCNEHLHNESWCHPGKIRGLESESVLTNENTIQITFMNASTNHRSENFDRQTGGQTNILTFSSYRLFRCQAHISNRATNIYIVAWSFFQNKYNTNFKFIFINVVF